MKNVSAVIPNYNGKQLLHKFIPHVFATLKTGDELIIVDDKSTDESVRYLIRSYKLKLTKISQPINTVSKKYFPQFHNLNYKLYSNNVIVNKQTIKVKLIVLNENMRFAASSNAGVLFAKHQYILLLNSDVKPTKNVRSTLLKHFDDVTVFGVGCLEYEKNKSGDKSGKNKLWFEKGMFMHSKAKQMTTGETAWVSGGSGMFDKQKWIKLNGFDQLFYPAYWEDLDLSYRAKQRGWKILFDENAVVFHMHETTNSDVFGQQKMTKMSWNNLSKFLKKHASIWQLVQYYLFSPYWTYAFWKHNRNIKLKNKSTL